LTIIAQQRTSSAPTDSPAPAGESAGRQDTTAQIVASMTTVLAVLLLVFVAEMVLVGPVAHARAQKTLYTQFRSDLADAVAPTGGLGADGKPVPVGDPVALMAIPSLGLKEVVAQGTTAEVLQHGPGHRRDSVLPGQAGTVVIYGRQATYGGPFRDIKNLHTGDPIAFITGEGKSLYKVTGIRHQGDKTTVTPGAARLTLVTAYGTPYLAQHVIRVDAELVGDKLPTGASPAVSLAASEQPMKGDKSALLMLLLWSQALLILALVLAWVRTVWGLWQSWIVAVPVLGVVAFKVAALVAQLLPNLL
jgi:sortase A